MDTKAFSPPLPLIWLYWSMLSVTAVLAATRIYTTLRYRWSLRNLSSDSPRQDSKPPQVPYTIPVLGQALSFLAPYPGEYWNNLFKTLPYSTGACTLLLGGRKAHVLYSPSAIHALFRARDTNRYEIMVQVLNKGMGAPLDDVYKYLGDPTPRVEKLNHDFMLKTERVNELTAKFIQVFHETLKQEAATIATLGEIGLYDWLRDRMFNASTTAVMGRRLLEMYPGLSEDFYRFDGEFMALFFGLPGFMNPGAFDRRERLLRTLASWIRKMHDESGGQPIDPDNDTAWEPHFGSRVNRARQLYYADIGLSHVGRAAYDLGFLFGLSSNAVPATGWMLFHILDPKAEDDLLGRILAEIVTAVRTDGSVDVSKLVSLPLLQSVFQEVLRLYTDVLVSKSILEDLKLPLNEKGDQHVLLEKGGQVFAPSWITHHNRAAWDGDVPSDTFFPERFLKTDEATGKYTFSTSGTAGKLIPFGGGKTMCPGRLFAKQEVLGAVARVLLDFDLDVIGYVDEKGKSIDSFPTPRKAFAGSGMVVMGGDLKVRMRVRGG